MNTPKPTPAELEADLERQRDELAATVDELQARLDVKARAVDKAHDLKDRATTGSGRPRPAVAIAVALAAAAAVALIVRRARH